MLALLRFANQNSPEYFTILIFKHIYFHYAIK